MLNITQDDYNIIKQRTQTRFVKLEFLDFQFRTVDEISGNLLGYSGTIDASSDLRRSCQVEAVVYGANKAKLKVRPGSEIWLSSYIRPYIGIQNIRTRQIQWYSQGIYLVNAPSWDYDEQTNTIKFEGLDLMSKLTGARNGQLEGIQHTIKAGENVRSAIISTLKMGGFNNYVVEECRTSKGVIQKVPNDISIEAGGTVYDILAALRDILPNYQMYFDVNGVFHYEPIPTGADEPIAFDDDLLGSIELSESINTDFEKVKNYIEVYGRSHTVKNYAASNTVSSGTISMAIDGLTSIAAGTLIGWTNINALNTNISLNVNGDGAKRLVLSDNTRVNHLDANTYYVATYQANGTWLFLGHQQARAIAYDNNPDSPFYVNGSVGRIRQVLSGGEYDNIQSDELAAERAAYELYSRARLQDTLSLYIIPIPWIDVNILISHQSPEEDEAKLYMIDSVSIPSDVTEEMTITAHRYYPANPII